MVGGAAHPIRSHLGVYPIEIRCQDGASFGRFCGAGKLGTADQKEMQPGVEIQSILRRPDCFGKVKPSLQGMTNILRFSSGEHDRNCQVSPKYEFRDASPI